MMEQYKSTDEVNSQVSFFLPKSLYAKLSRAANENKTDIYTELLQRLESSFNSSSSPESNYESLVDTLSQKMREALVPIRDMNKTIIDSLSSQINKGLSHLQESVHNEFSEQGSSEKNSTTMQDEPCCNTGSSCDHSAVDEADSEEEEVRRRVEAKHDFIEAHSEMFQEEMQKDPSASLNMIYKRVKDRVKSGC